MPMSDPSAKPNHVVPAHEPDAWYDLHTVDTGTLMDIEKDLAREGLGSFGPVTMAVHAIAKALVAWSWPVPISVDTVRRLDRDTLNVLSDAAMAQRSDAEKKESLTGSEDGPTVLYPEPGATAFFPPSSPIGPTSNGSPAGISSPASPSTEGLAWPTAPTPSP